MLQVLFVMYIIYVTSFICNVPAVSSCKIITACQTKTSLLIEIQ